VADVFISYSKARKKETIVLAAALEKRGVTVWWDKDITPGETFRKIIEKELAEARAVIVIWTPQSVKSDWVISEAGRGRKRNVLIAVHSSDLDRDDIPQPFDVVHTELVDNLTAVSAGLARLGIVVAGDDSPDDGKPPQLAPPPWPSRRAVLLGAGVLSLGAVGAFLIPRPSNKIDPGRPARKLSGHGLYVSSVAYAAGGRGVLSASWDQTLRLWDPISETELRRFDDHSGAVWSVAVLPDGNHAVSAGADRTLRSWDLSKSRSIGTFNGHEDEVWAVAALPDGKRILSGSKDMTLRLWDIASTTALKTFQTDAKVSSVALVPDGTTAVAATAGGLQSWDLVAGERRRLFGGHVGGVNSVAVAPSGRQVISAGDDGTLRLWEVSSGQPIRSFPGHVGKKALAVAVAPNGRIAVSGGSDAATKLWNLSTGDLIASYNHHVEAVDAVAIAPDGRTVATGSQDKTVVVWDLPQGFA
jgi:WD40 repeat protein